MNIAQCASGLLATRRVAGSAFAVLAVVLLAPLSAPSPVRAQQGTQLPQTRLGAVFPCGGQAGTTFEVKVIRGVDIDGLTSLLFNHPGIKAVPKQQNGKVVANTFAVTIAGNVPSGLYEVRAVGKFGLSNPRAFVVGRLEETEEKEANNTLETANPVEINRTINGTINGATDIDFFQFDGKAGQNVVVDCRARRIDSQLEATLEVYGPDGRRLVYTQGGTRNDPVTVVRLPSNGRYTVKIYDFTYRGGPDYFYRLSLHTGPHIDFVLPPSGPAGKTSRFTLYGRNLPGGKPSPFRVDGQPLQKLDVQIALPAERTLIPAENFRPHEAGMDGIRYVLKTAAGESNPVQIYFADAPVTLEKEPNDDPKQAQPVTVPAEIAGQFQQRGDIDYVTFSAKAGEVYYVEVYSQRLGTTADPFLKVEQVSRDAKGVEKVRVLSSSDDNTPPVSNTALFNGTTDDPVVRLQIPADGTYRISVRDRYFEARGDPRLIYRLVIRRPQWDFRAVVLPVSPGRQQNQPATSGVLALRKGENLLAEVYLFRKDGFDEAVELTAEGLPPGVHCSGTVIGPGSNRSYLVFSADESAKEWAGLIRLVAKARVADPAKVAQVKKAEAEIAAAEKALPALRKTLQQMEAPWKRAEQQLAQAKAAAAKKPKDKGLAARVASLQKQADAARKKYETAKAALAAGEKRLTDAQARLKKAEAERTASIRTVTHPVRPATVVWDAVANRSLGLLRVAQSLGLSVLKETAPVQLLTDVYRVEVNQGRQVLVPVKLLRRNGFNKNVTVAVDGLPRNSNIQVQVKPFNQKETQHVYQILVKTNAKPGTYTFFLRAPVQVSYRKNVEELEAAKKRQAEANKAAQAAAGALKAATQKQAAATRQAAADAQALKQATANLQAAQKKLAAAKAAVTKNPKDKTAQNALAAAQKQFDAANKALQQAQAKAKASAEAKAKADAEVKAATARSNAAAAAKRTADQQLRSATAVAKAKNLNLVPMSPPIVLDVRPAPATLSASVPGGGKLKRGGKIAVKVTLRRINGFTGPVRLSLPLPPGVQGLSAAEVTIPADKNDGVLTIQAAGNATTGQLANLVIRATTDFHGKAAVDVPITLNVAK